MIRSFSITCEVKQNLFRIAIRVMGFSYMLENTVYHSVIPKFLIAITISLIVSLIEIDVIVVRTLGSHHCCHISNLVCVYNQERLRKFEASIFQGIRILFY